MSRSLLDEMSREIAFALRGKNDASTDAEEHWRFTGEVRRQECAMAAKAAAEVLAKWMEPQRNDIPMTGEEAAAAIRHEVNTHE